MRAMTREVPKLDNTISNRYEFVFFFEAENSNPNGDPDAGNMPRLDAETSHGIVTDVCLKRKIRNYVELVRDEVDGYDIYVREGAVLNNQHLKAYKSLDLDPKDAKAARSKMAELQGFMCRNFYDVRTFGAVMSTEVSCGQIRGPVQLAFARSADPIVPQELSITRMAVTNERDVDKERTMGRKYVVPYALYRAEGYVSASLAAKTGFGSKDLELLFEAVERMFEHDRSAARGKMATRAFFVFRHSSPLGDVPAYRLFDSVRVSRANPKLPPRKFADYRVDVVEGTVPESVELIRRV